VVREAQDLLAEALARKPGGKRPLRPGMIIRYFFHAMGGKPPEAVLHQGYDRIELLRTKEPRVFLAALKQWVFSKECCIMPHDSRMPGIEARINAKLAAREAETVD
jgi:hypothetical protein